MKIAIISLLLPSGSKIGVGFQAHYLANELVRRGHVVTVFSQSGLSADSLYQVEVIAPGRRLRTFDFAWKLRRYDFSRFDVINAHGDDWFLWGVKRPRHVHTFHGSCLAEMLNVNGLKEKMRMGALALCEYGACLLADHRVAVSANTRRYIPAVRQVIPCGVNLNEFSPAKEKSRAPAVLFVGTMHGRKRGALLRDVFMKEVRAAIPNAELWAVCEQPVTGDGVRWFGRVRVDVLSDLFRRAWAFCLPSTYEGFGVPYIEAMASGTAVVATRNPGALEVTRAGKDGLIVGDRDLGKALVRVLTDNELRASLETAGLIRCRDFSWDRICEQYEAAYAGSTARVREATAL